MNSNKLTKSEFKQNEAENKKQYTFISLIIFNTGSEYFYTGNEYSQPHRPEYYNNE